MNRLFDDSPAGEAPGLSRRQVLCGIAGSLAGAALAVQGLWGGKCEGQCPPPPESLRAVIRAKFPGHNPSVGIRPILPRGSVSLRSWRRSLYPCDDTNPIPADG
jgi:hypothetical protein